MTNQPNEAGNWAANNPAYELFFIQAEVHHRQRHSPSPDNTEAQVPDMPSEIAMDGDNDSLANVRPNILTLLKSLTWNQSMKPQFLGAVYYLTNW